MESQAATGPELQRTTPGQAPASVVLRRLGFDCAVTRVLYAVAELALPTTLWSTCLIREAFAPRMDASRRLREGQAIAAASADHKRRQRQLEKVQMRSI